MVIHIKLSDRRTAASDDPLGRSWFGFDRQVTPEELWQNNRGDWRLSAESIAEEQWAALNHAGRIVLVAELEDPAYEDLASTTPKKKALLGRVLPEGHPVRDALFDKPVVYPPRSRNSIWYEAIPELDDLVENGLTPVLDRPGEKGQGLQMDSAVRKTIEDAAQNRLMTYYRDLGFTVTDTRLNRPYDAVADKGSERIYLEAKGTQSRGVSVIVTHNEVDHAKQHPGACVMGIWSEMMLVDGAVDTASGKFTVLPFNPDDQDLRPRDYDWTVPEVKPNGSPAPRPQ